MALKPVPSAADRAKARRLLRRCFAARGYIRSPNRRRLAKEGAQAYKKGTEVRLVVYTAAEIAALRRALRMVGLRPGKWFVKHSRYIQPVYGATAAEWFAGED